MLETLFAEIGDIIRSQFLGFVLMKLPKTTNANNIRTK